ncbi:GCN5-related N-acetyltransferase (plasmid) [Gemmatirosa kalamazoonensis]|uniref:GCN5-related N-acetyltransferase n=1 Tax=Gemmatirosa kalamazoonensis TaxID=861299 RepID=W0RPH3_9BACT|nr:GNAT family N-acetyltransferase [Gemmatirosa kalamazoonensis]AHG92225.1 GCN5-related N-acetyltransferase [Gemmatirosa kalamazoonensis]
MIATPRLETARLILRPTALEDLDRWAEMLADEAAARFIGGVQAKPVVWRQVMTMAGAWTLTGVAMFSVIERSSGRWIGRVGPWEPLGWPGPEVGWALHPDAWGNGYAVEAAAATMDYAFDVLGWPDVIHSIDAENAASKRVAERLGSAYRAAGRLPAPYEHVPVEIWGQTREEWRARRR